MSLFMLWIDIYVNTAGVLVNVITAGHLNIFPSLPEHLLINSMNVINDFVDKYSVFVS